MEDIFWESPYNSSLQDEYFLVKQNTSSLDFFKKQENIISRIPLEELIAYALLNYDLINI
jgi:hypothetical protein